MFFGIDALQFRSKTMKKVTSNFLLKQFNKAINTSISDCKKILLARELPFWFSEWVKYCLCAEQGYQLLQYCLILKRFLFSEYSCLTLKWTYKKCYRMQLMKTQCLMHIKDVWELFVDWREQIPANHTSKTLLTYWLLLHFIPMKLPYMFECTHISSWELYHLDIIKFVWKLVRQHLLSNLASNYSRIVKWIRLSSIGTWWTN